MTNFGLISICKTQDDIPIHHLVDVIGAQTRCGMYSAWGTSCHSKVTNVEYYDLSKADANGNLCSNCLREAPIEKSRSWGDGAPQHKRRGAYVDDYDALLQWLEEVHEDTA